MIEVPLQLWNRPHWELKGRWDGTLFFKHIQAVMPSATSLFVEGTGIAKDVSDFLHSAAQPGDYLPARQTLWPRAKRYRLSFNDATLAALAKFVEHHSEPELLDHLFVYEGASVLLEFPDAFAKHCPAFFSRQIDEERIRNFATILRLEISDETGS